MSSGRKLKVAVVGCGAVGSYYGAMLARAGHDVRFLMRSDYEAVRRSGLAIESKHGSFVLRANAARSPDEIGVSDLVLVGLKTTANHEFGRLLPPLVGPRTAVLTLQNGLGNEEQLANYFPGEQLLGGLCFVCLNRVAPGRILHIGHGQVVLGEFAQPLGPRAREIAGAFQKAGVPCTVTDCLPRARWEKLMWNVPFNGLGVAGTAGLAAVESGVVPSPLPSIRACLATDELLGDERWLRLVQGLMDEVRAGAEALGLRIGPGFNQVMIEKTRPMGAYKASTLLDFERGLPLEIESLFEEPRRQAAGAGQALPLLQNLCRVLRALDQSRVGRPGANTVGGV